MYLKRARDPYDSQQAGAEHRYDKRDDDISDTPQRPGQHLQEYIEDIARRNETEHPGTKPHDFCVCREDAKKGHAENEEKDNKDSGKEQVDAKADTDALFYPVCLSCPVILADKCGDGDAEGTAHHPEQPVQLVIYRPCRRRVGTEPVQRCLDHRVGDIVHDRLEARRQPDAQQQSEDWTVDADLRQRQLKHRISPDEPERHEQGAYSL